MRFYCLRSEVAGREEVVRLEPGINRVGNLQANHIVLSESGVSRHHAVLEVDEAQVVLEDLASKNGTFVNSRRVRRRKIEIGDVVAFGHRRFRLDELDADEAVLAIELGGNGRGPESSRSLRETTHVVKAAAPELGQAMRGVAGIARCLCRRDGADLGGALAILCQTLQTPAAWVLELGEDDRPMVLATCGAVDEALLTAVTERFAAEAAETPRLAEGEGIWIAPSPALPAAGYLLPATAPAVGLWIAKPGFDSGVDQLLRAVTYLVDRSRTWRTSSRRKTEVGRAAELVLPEGYVPGSSPQMTALYDQMRPLVQGDLPALILGETGVGKEYLARILHVSSPRREQAFVAVNCAAIPADLLEAELFGVEKGAATGVAARAGTFQQAHLGTLFLDEIGDMSADLQAKLLRALEEQEIRPVGGSTTSVDVRLVAATNVEIERRIAAGEFRADLYYRLAGCTLVVPPLRQRRDDIADLVEHFVRSYSAEIGKPIRGVTVKALRRLIGYDWPGNIRELEHEVRRLVYTCRAGQAIDASSLSAQICGGAAATEGTSTAAIEIAAPGPGPELDGGRDRYDLARLEKQAIRDALDAVGGKRVAAARLLGISRDALRRRIARHGLEPAH